MSTAELTCAGSRLVTSLLKPKRNVWSAARFTPFPPPPGPQAANTNSAPIAMARERNLELPVIQPPQENKPRKAYSSGAILDIHRPLPGGPGRECAGDRLRHLAMPPLLHGHLGAYTPLRPSSRRVPEAGRPVTRLRGRA